MDSYSKLLESPLNCMQVLSIAFHKLFRNLGNLKKHKTVVDRVKMVRQIDVRTCRIVSLQLKTSLI